MEGRGIGRTSGRGRGADPRGADGPGRGRGRAEDRGVPDVSENDFSRRTLEFWKEVKNLHGRGEHHRINLVKQDERRLWTECWTAVGSRDPRFEPAPIILKIFLGIPAAASSLPPLNDVAEALVAVAQQARQRLRGSEPLRAQLLDLEMVADTVKLRLHDHLASFGQFDRGRALDAIRDVKAAFDECTSALFEKKMDADLKKEVRRVDRRLEDIDRFITLLENTAAAKDDAVAETSLAERPWTGWLARPTVGWLMSGSWQDFPELRSSYASSDEYAETLLRTWTALTFYWGAGAVWPKCHHSQGPQAGGADREVKVCGEPLLCRAHHSRQLFCSSKIGGSPCPNRAAWKCYRFGHEAICSRCLSVKQEAMVGPPSKSASTDVYDAQVVRESYRREGTIFMLQSLTSRKPPAVAPNWKTSYRLATAGLVAVVKLSSSKEGLRRGATLQWAEVVPFDARSKEPDASFRAKG